MKYDKISGFADEIAEGVDTAGLGLSLVERLVKLSGGMII